MCGGAIARLLKSAGVRIARDMLHKGSVLTPPGKIMPTADHDAKVAAMKNFVEHVIPGRWELLRPIKATARVGRRAAGRHYLRRADS